MQLVRGTLGKQLTIYERNGQVIMATKRSPSNKKPTQKQLAAREKMSLASGLAQRLMADPEIRAYYESLAGPGQNAYNMAVKDAYHSPEVQNIRVEGTDVVVTAKDEFRIAAVEVKVTDAEGVITESGQAVLGRNGVDWYYKATVLPPGAKVIVAAENLPGCQTVKELLITYPLECYQ